MDSPLWLSIQIQRPERLELEESQICRLRLWDARLELHRAQPTAYIALMFGMPPPPRVKVAEQPQSRWKRSRKSNYMGVVDDKQKPKPTVPSKNNRYKKRQDSVLIEKSVNISPTKEELKQSSRRKAVRRLTGSFDVIVEEGEEPEDQPTCEDKENWPLRDFDGYELPMERPSSRLGSTQELEDVIQLPSKARPGSLKRPELARVKLQAEADAPLAMARRPAGYGMRLIGPPTAPSPLRSTVIAEAPSTNRLRRVANFTSEDWNAVHILLGFGCL